MSPGAQIALGLVGLFTAGGVAYVVKSSAAAPAPAPAAPTTPTTPATSTAPTGASYAATGAIPVSVNSTLTVPLGSSVVFDPPGSSNVWNAPGATSSDATILAPSSPATTDGFVAVGLGTATLTGTYSSGTVMATVTVVPAAAGAIPSGSGPGKGHHVGAIGPGAGASSGGGAGGGLTPTGFTLPTPTVPVAGGGNTPTGGGATPTLAQGVTSSAATQTGWAQQIGIVQGMVNGAYQGFIGDVITISLPSGCSWRADPNSVGPSSGSAPLVFTLVEAFPCQLMWTDAGGNQQTSHLTFTLGGTFQQTTTLATGDYVIAAAAGADVLSMVELLGMIAQNAATAIANAAEAVSVQQVATLLAVESANPSAAGAAGIQQVFARVFLIGPWGQAFAPDPDSFVSYPPSTTLPAWWPPDDTAAASEYHAVYRYMGAPIAVSSLPLQAITYWHRVA